MGINAPVKKEDAWDKVAKALAIANQGLGVVAGVQNIVNNASDTDAENRVKQGILTPKEQLEYSKDYNQSDTQTPGSFALKTHDGKPVYYSPKVKSAENPGLMTPAAFMELKNKQFTEVAPGTHGADIVYVPGPDGKPVAHSMIAPKFSDQNAAAAKEPKSDQFKVAQFGQRMQQSENVFAKLGQEGFDPTSLGTGAQRTTFAGLGVPNRLKSSQVQQQEQAERSFINAVLRRESGAAISDTEFGSGEKQYFPRGGDSSDVLQQKAENRALAINGFKQEAGTAWEKVGSGGGSPTMIAAKQGKPSSLSPEAVAGNGTMSVRVVDGKMYKKVKGGWQRQ